MSLSVIHQAHDKFIKLSLGEPRVALEFFTEHLPASFLKAIDLMTLQLQKQTFIDEHFKNSEADIIYSVQAANATAYLFLLCEHQSTVDPWIREIEEQGVGGFSLAKFVIKYIVDGIEAKDAKLFTQSVQKYLSPELRKETMTLADVFRDEGSHQGQATMMTRQLQHRFQQIPAYYLDKIKQADEETLLSWSEKILEAKSLEEIFE